jgi:hypothetical protein
MSFEEWSREKPCESKYMPEWNEKEKTYFMLYECTTEGTPLSPAFKTVEELAKWSFDNNITIFANITVTYEEWLSIISKGSVDITVVQSVK